MKISNLTVKKLYISLITSVMCFTVGFSAQAQLKLAPKNSNKAGIQKAEALDLISQLKKVSKTYQKPSALKIKDLDLILFGDNVPKINPAKKEVEGPRTGGGNGCALSIMQNKNKLMSILPDEKILSKDELNKMKTKLETTKYYVVKDQAKMLLNGETKDAVNVPAENSIYFSDHFCRAEMSDVSARSMSLLFHEYLGLMTVKADGSIDTTYDDRNYDKSGRFLEIMSLRNQANNELIEFLKAEAAKDLTQQSGLFKGEVERFKNKMQAVYGERFRADEAIQIDVLMTSASVPTILNQYASKKYDAFWNGAENSQNAIYGVYDTFEQESYIVTLKYKASTSRSFETVSKEFLLKREAYHQNVQFLSLTVATVAKIDVPKKISDTLINKISYSLSVLDTDDRN